MRNKLVVTGLILAIGFLSPGAAGSQDLDACALLPGSPTHRFRGKLAEIEIAPYECLGLYGPRTARFVFGDITEFLYTIHIIVSARPDIAKDQVKRGAYDKVSKPVDLGDGGLQAMEDPNDNDIRAANEEEQKSGEYEASATSMVEQSTYRAAFSCGRVAVKVEANPSRASAARELVKELDANLRSKGLCGPSGISVPSQPVIPARSESGTGSHTRVFSGETARQIQAFNSKNARYLVVLDRHFDAQQNCWVEARAFAGGIRGSGGDQVSVAVGPARTFCLNGTVYSVEQVNAAQNEIANARDYLAKVLEYDAKYDAYLKNHPNDANSRTFYNTNKKWIDYYKKVIANYETAIANSIPQ